MTEQTVTPDNEAEWMTRFTEAVKDGPKITKDIVDTITEEHSLLSVVRFAGLSHLRLYWISLELFEQAKREGKWTPEMVSDLSCVDWLISKIECKPCASQRVTPHTPEDWQKLGGEKAPTP